MPASSTAHDVLQCAVGRIAGHLPGTQLPAEADPPQQVQHGQVLPHLGRRHQGSEDDPRLATIDDVMVVVAQIQPPPRERMSEASRSVALARKSATRW